MAKNKTSKTSKQVKASKSVKPVSKPKPKVEVKSKPAVKVKPKSKPVAKAAVKPKKAEPKKKIETKKIEPAKAKKETPKKIESKKVVPSKSGAVTSKKKAPELVKKTVLVPEPKPKATKVVAESKPLPKKKAESKNNEEEVILEPVPEIDIPVLKPVKEPKVKKEKTPKKPPKKVAEKKVIIVIGHRGNSGYFPENTIESISSCFHIPGIMGAEFDVQMTRDGEIVIFHDDDTSRFSEEKNKIASSSYLELKKIDIGGWFSPEFKNKHIPTLDDVMGVLTYNNPQFFYNIEIKKSPFLRGEMLKNFMTKLFQVVDSWVEPKRVLYTSFDWECLDLLRHHGQEIRLGVLTDQPDERGWISKVKQLNAEFIIIPMSKIDSEFMDIVKTELEAGVIGYTEFEHSQKEKELQLVAKVKEFNISGLIVNYPSEVKEMVTVIKEPAKEISVV